MRRIFWFSFSSIFISINHRKKGLRSSFHFSFVVFPFIRWLFNQFRYW
ncbi:hypothetical protein OIU78_016304 [Salix suchowensis]|nr:hypothetical protein OIU78_016304 [Salix suchowensis]